jgi:hypothetical protein
MPGNAAISLSNIGASGLQYVKSPLLPNEVLKFTLLAVEKKPVWNKKNQSFEPIDCLPISFSADHRIFNGDVPIPKHISNGFHAVFDRMCTADIEQSEKGMSESMMMSLIESLIKMQPQIGYKLLISLQTVWPNFVDFEAWVSSQMKEHTLGEAV